MSGETHLGAPSAPMFYDGTELAMICTLWPAFRSPPKQPRLCGAIWGCDTLQIIAPITKIKNTSIATVLEVAVWSFTCGPNGGRGR